MTRNTPRSFAAIVSATVVFAGLNVPARAVSPTARDTGPAPQAFGAPAQGRPIAGREALPDPSADKLVRAPRAVRWPGNATLALRADGKATSVGGLSISSDRQLSVRTVDRAASERAGVNGPIVVVSGGDGVGDGRAELGIGYRDFAAAYGGDYGSRLGLVSLPACALTTPDRDECRGSTPLEHRNDVVNGKLVATVAAGETVVAMQSGASSAQGTYRATQLNESSSWSVSPNAGGFSWQHPIRLPGVPGKFTPQVAIGYGSQGVDGRMATTNNQSSWIGEGFGFEPGYIERRYQPCAVDGHTTSPDQCWAFHNGTLMLSGHSGNLVRISDNVWKLSNDDGTKVERLSGTVNGDDNGEYWKVSTVDGMTYYFGLNRVAGYTSGKEETNSAWTVPVYGDDSGEPCYHSDFAQAWCQQGWRFNLDHIVDRLGNTITYFYKKETNYYARGANTSVNGTPYTRGGYLSRIDYGQRDGQVYTTPAPARIVFSDAERCLPSGAITCAEAQLTPANASHWPDVPSDLLCAKDTRCTSAQVFPTFFTRKRLQKIHTEVRSGGTWKPVESWTVEHAFYLNDDGSYTLWPKTITHAGLWGGQELKLPAIEFEPVQKANRVDSTVDSLGPITRMRLNSIKTETGAQIHVQYAPTECAPGSVPTVGNSTVRCFASIYRKGSQTTVDWFHKYVVGRVTVRDLVGGNDNMVTEYGYDGGAQWRKGEPDGFSKDEDLTWSDWRGYGKVTVRSGDEYTLRTRVEHFYLRGMSGGKRPDGSRPAVNVTDSTGTVYPDRNQFSGHEYETVTYNGNDAISKTTAQPWLHTTHTWNASWGAVTADIVRTDVKRSLTRLLPDAPTGQQRWRETKNVSTFDTTWGRAIQIEDFGDISTGTDDKCSRIEYADNATRHLYSLPWHTQTVAVRCNVTANLATQLLSDDIVGYDLRAPGEAPTGGVLTRKETLDRWDGSQIRHAVSGGVTTALDAYGRPTSAADAAGNVTTTAYTETEGLTTKIVTTNPLSHKTTETLDPAYGARIAFEDANLSRSYVAYDQLGRLVSVWLPNRDKLTNASPNTTFSYLVRNNKTTVVTTKTLRNDGGYDSSHELFDGLLRSRQTQTPADGGWLLTDTVFNGTGKVRTQNASYFATGAVGDVPLSVPADSLQGSTWSAHDGADRVIVETFAVGGTGKWSTTTSYQGDRTSMDPPSGSVPTTTVFDARGRTTELWQYHGSAPSGSADISRYTYALGGEVETITDPLGNRWKYEYNQRGQRTAVTDPDSGRQVTRYDTADRVAAVTDARDITISTKYDELSRVVETWQGEVGTGVKLTQNKFDSTRKGQLYWTARFTTTGTHYIRNDEYDSLDRPVTTVYQISGNGAGAELGANYRYKTTYNLDGTVQSVDLPAAGNLPAETVVTTYDTLRRPIGLNGIAPYLTVPNAVGNKGYSPLSQLTKVELHTGGANKKAWRLWDYETGTGRVNRARVTREAPGVNDVDARYSYDQTGNVLSIADTPGSGIRDIQCFKYDNLRRLTEAWATASTATDPCAGGDVGGPAPYHEKWTFDAVGNRRTETIFGVNGAADVTREYSYPAQGSATPNRPHVPTAVTQRDGSGVRTFEYGSDAAGQSTCMPASDAANACGETKSHHQAMTWDAEGHLASSTPAGGQPTTFAYDPGGNRLLRKEPSATTLYLPGMELRLDTTTHQVSGTRYYSFAGQPVAVRGGAAAVSFHIADHHGTPTAAIDAASGAIDHRRSTPYGKVRGIGAMSSSWLDDKGFVGGTKDSTTGLTHLGAREYDPTTGRFISDDPVFNPADPQSINGFGYANGNPTSMSDPGGTCVTESSEGGCYKPPADNGGGDEDCSAEDLHQCTEPEATQSPVLSVTTYPNGLVLVEYRDGRVSINGYFLPAGHPTGAALYTFAATVDSAPSRFNFSVDNLAWGGNPFVAPMDITDRIARVCKRPESGCDYSFTRAVEGDFNEFHKAAEKFDHDLPGRHVCRALPTAERRDGCEGGLDRMGRGFHRVWNNDLVQGCVGGMGLGTITGITKSGWAYGRIDDAALKHFAKLLPKFVPGYLEAGCIIGALANTYEDWRPKV